MRNNQPATVRQKSKLKELGVECPDGATIDDAAMLLRDAYKDKGIWDTPKKISVPLSALAVESEGDPLPGRQWE